MVEKFGVEKFLFALGLKSSWLKSPGLKDLGLKLGVEKSGVEMSFNLSERKIQSIIGTHMIFQNVLPLKSQLKTSNLYIFTFDLTILKIDCFVSNFFVGLSNQPQKHIKTKAETI